MTEKLASIVNGGERENIEFKEYLSEEVHLNSTRFENLACQLNHRLIMGRGEALYVLGVTDSGDLKGVSRERLQESLRILELLSTEIGAEIKEVEEYRVDGGWIALVTITKRGKPREHILIGTAGHVDHGKSTLVGTLVTGIPDDGSGKTRLFLDVQKHEIERGLSADLSYAVYGFKGKNTLHLKNPLNKHEKAKIVESAEKLVSFVDTVGHEPWLRTTIRGLVGQKLDYGLLVVAADDGVTRTTKEHLGILLAMELPTIVAVTKIDRVEKNRVQKVLTELSGLLREIGRIPYFVKNHEELRKASEMLSKRGHLVIPILALSPVTMEGIDLLNELIRLLPKRFRKHREDFIMYIDKVYKITGVGTVVSGTVKQGVLYEGEEVFIGPTISGDFIRARVQSIEIHHYRVEQTVSGDVVGIAVKGVDVEDVRRGMVVMKENPESVWEFTADVLVFNHPTKIKAGYEPVLHLETISESVIFTEVERGYLKAGERGRVRIRFKYHPYFIQKGQKFIFREGRSKGYGRVLSCG